MSKRSVLLIMLFCLALAHPVPVDAALTVNIDDTFTVTFEVHLTGSSGSYDDYTEYENETRVYDVLDISGDVVQYQMARYYYYSDSDGYRLTDTNLIYFQVDRQTGEYLNGTMDAPSSYTAYYTFDNIWFQIDPSVQPGDTIRILGFDYTVIGETDFFYDGLTAYDAIEVRATYSYNINDPEYDPNGPMDVTVTESYFYDPTTGYYLGSVYDADVDTSLGDFSWHEEGRVKSSSYSPHVDEEASTTRRITILFIVALPFILCGVCKYRGARKIRKEVDHALALLSGQVPIPTGDKPGVTPTLWDPLTIPYQQLLEGADAPNRVTLAPGVFLVIEIDDRLVIVNTQNREKPDNVVIRFREEDIKALYRLALGTLDRNSPEFDHCASIIPNFEKYIVPASEVGAVDEFAFTQFSSSLSKMFSRIVTGTNASGMKLAKEILAARALDSAPQNEDLVEASRLLARRKVLDYSLGQAPLSSSSHLSKVNYVMQHAPGSVLLVGDDDLISVTLARRGIAVTLVEIDPYTCALVASIAQREGLNLRIFQADLRDPLPLEVETFDLFVADPDFTIEAFGLFLSRGISALHTGGIGLINFEAKGNQIKKARILLERLNVEVIEQPEDTWTYVILRNTVAVGRTRSTSGKYSHIRYEEVVGLFEAPYKSVMFVVRKNPETRVALSPEAQLEAPPSAIYDI